MIYTKEMSYLGMRIKWKCTYKVISENEKTIAIKNVTSRHVQTDYLKKNLIISLNSGKATIMNLDEFLDKNQLCLEAYEIY